MLWPILLLDGDDHPAPYLSHARTARERCGGARCRALGPWAAAIEGEARDPAVWSSDVPDGAVKGRSMSRFPLVLCIGTLLPVALGFAGKPDSASPLVADGAVQVTQAELDALVGNKLLRVRTEEYLLKRGILEDHLARLLLEREAATRKLTVDDLIRTEIDMKTAPVTEQEARAVYENSKAGFVGESEEQAVKQIADGMRARRIALRRAEYVKALRTKAHVRIGLEPPRIDVTAGDGVTKGSGGAPVTIVEYSDFQCPYCAQMASTLRRISAKYGDQVRFVYRDYPLPFHKDAPKAAEAASCAREQDKFWEMHDALFANQNALALADLKRYAAQIGLEATAFAQCLDSGRTEQSWRKSKELADAYGVGSTPTLFVNGRVVNGAYPFEFFDQVIEEELLRAGGGKERTATDVK
jgi:protein-disulfide isomerase